MKSPRESFQAMLDKTIEERPDLFDSPDDFPAPQWVLDFMASGEGIEIDMENVQRLARKAKRNP